MSAIQAHAGLLLAGAGSLTLTQQVQALFAGAPGGMWAWDIAGNSYTDSARTTPVTTAGDAIGSSTDLSGNGKHVSSSSTARPLYQSAARFDGMDDCLATASIDFTGTDAVTVVTSLRKNSDVSQAMLYELSASSNANTGTFRALAPATSGTNTITVGARGSGSLVATSPISGLVAPVTFIHTMQQKISTPVLRHRVNGGAWTTSSNSQGTGNLSNNPLNIGSRGGGVILPYNGDIFRQCAIGRQLSDAETALVEAWANEPTGVTLP